MEADVLVQIIDSDLPPIPAVSRPSLLIKIDDTYWQPLAMVGYRLDDAADQSEIDGCTAVIDRFNAAEQASATHVAVHDTVHGIVRSNNSTTPPNQSS